MTDTIRTRIANAAGDFLSDNFHAYLEQDVALELADAVIAELGLHQESGLSGYHVTINPGGYHKRGTHVARYCTEWTADD